MERRVFVESWQWQCCGEPFAVGDTVTWIVAPNVDREWFTNLLHDDAAMPITDVEDHHSTEQGEIERITGTVGAIDAVFCQYAPKPAGPQNSLYPVPGTDVFEPRTRADGWEHEDHRGPSEGDRWRSFVGYLVSLEKVQSLGKWPGWWALQDSNL